MRNIYVILMAHGVPAWLLGVLADMLFHRDQVFGGVTLMLFAGGLLALGLYEMRQARELERQARQRARHRLVRRQANRLIDRL